MRKRTKRLLETSSSRLLYGRIVISGNDEDSSFSERGSSLARHQSHESAKSSKPRLRVRLSAPPLKSRHRNAPDGSQARTASSRNIRPAAYSARRGNCAESPARRHVRRSEPPSTDATISAPSTRSVNKSAPLGALSGYPIAVRSLSTGVSAPDRPNRSLDVVSAIQIKT